MNNHFIEYSPGSSLLLCIVFSFTRKCGDAVKVNLSMLQFLRGVLIPVTLPQNQVDGRSFRTQVPDVLKIGARVFNILITAVHWHNNNTNNNNTKFIAST